MTFSIIIPVYNCIDFLPSLADIISKIKGEAFEVILIDDGSTDGSGEVCDEIAHKNANVRVLHKQNGGVSSARNMGLEAAQGEYVGFLDADDSVKPEMYVSLINSARTHSSDMVMGGYVKVSGESRNDVLLPLCETETDTRKIAWSMAFWNAWLEGRYLPTLYGSVWPNLYKRDLINDNNIRFPSDISIGEDLLFNLEYIACVKKISVVNEALYEYNIANSSATRKRNTRLWQNYGALLERTEMLIKKLYETDEDLEYNIHRQRINYAINVIEEQLCVFFGKKDAVREIKKLCGHEKLRESAKIIMGIGKSKKVRIQAALIYWKFTGLIWRWLK